MTSPDGPGRAAASRSPAPEAGMPPVVDAERLFGQEREVVIVHRGERYRLRITQSGKLILTK